MKLRAKNGASGIRAAYTSASLFFPSRPRSADAGNLAAAYEQAKAMVRRRPDSGVAHFTLSYVLRYVGLLQEAMRIVIVTVFAQSDPSSRLMNVRARS